MYVYSLVKIYPNPSLSLNPYLKPNLNLNPKPKPYPLPNPTICPMSLLLALAPRLLCVITIIPIIEILLPY